MSTVTVPIGPSRLRPPREALDPRVRAWWRLHVVAPPVLAAVVLAILALVLPGAGAWLITALVAVAALGVATAVWLPGLWYRRHRWELTDDAVYTRGGLVWIEWRAAPLARVQTVEGLQGPVQRWFGIATLVVTTASAKGAVTVVGIDDDRASALAAALTRRTQTVPGDAT